MRRSGVSGFARGVWEQGCLRDASQRRLQKDLELWGTWWAGEMVSLCPGCWLKPPRGLQSPQTPHVKVWGLRTVAGGGFKGAGLCHMWREAHVPVVCLARCFWPTAPGECNGPNPRFLKAWGVCALPGVGVDHFSEFPGSANGRTCCCFAFAPFSGKAPPTCKGCTPCYCFVLVQPSEPQSHARKTGRVSSCFECTKISLKHCSPC